MAEPDDRRPGLAWPDHDTGPVPPPGSGGGEPATRPPLAPWDRVKFLVLLGVLWGVFFWALKSDNPIITWGDAARETLRSKWWLFALALVECTRQLHYAVSEQWAAYHRFWSQRVFGGVERRSTRMNDWTRYRIGRAIRAGVAVAALAVALGAVYHESPVIALFELPRRVWDASPLLLQIAFGFFFGIVQFIGIFWFLSRGGVDVYYPDDIKTRFSDVWGQDAVLERVKENILFLENPEAIEAKGGYVPGGILLWGPPGTGKTLMAEAVAGETGKPYVFVDPGAFINMFVGVGILKVKALFRRLRKLALRYGGVIVFFDEADSLGNRGALAPGNWGGATANTMLSHTPPCNGWSYLDQRTASFLFQQSLAAADPVPPRRDRVIVGGFGGGGMGTLQALLTELSGLKKPRGFVNRVVRRALGMRPKPPPKYRILVMMATNMPQALDEALLRPGRIDRIYKVGYPSKAGRIRTYEGYLAKVSHTLTAADIDKLATITPYATGATIKDLVNEALIVAIRDGRDTITWADIVKAKQLKDLGPPEDVEYIERERHAVAIHEACHAVVAYRVRQHLTIDIATIEKGGTYLGLVASIPPEDQFTRWRTEYEADIMVSLASLAGERMFFDGDSSSGVSGDLESATQIATLMEGYWGMGTTVAVHGVTQKVGIVGGGKPGDEGARKDRDLLASGLGARIEAKLAELLARTEALIAENRGEILAVAHALETHKTVTGDDIEAIIEGRQGPLIDGRPYQDPAFREAAEAYHAQVVAAHKAHRRVEVPLPELNGHREPVGVLAGEGDPDTAEAVPAPVDLEPGTPPRRPRPLRARRDDGTSES